MSRAGLSEEARFELSMAASGRERRNTPRHLIYLAAAAVAVAGIAALVEARAWSRAGRETTAALAKDAEVREKVKEYQALKAEGGGSDQARAGFDKMVSTGERLAEAAGLAKPPKPREPDKPDVRGNVVHRTWTYSRVKSGEAGPLMEWVQSMLTEMSGLRVSSIKLTPGEQGWSMDVTFAGAERVGGGA
jgi:hypothetical protein